MRFRREVGHEVPSGWHYPVPGGPLLKAKSEIPQEAVDDLVDQLTMYRVNNGLPIGDPFDAILCFYSKNYPFTVENGEPERQPQPDQLEQDVVHWINTQWKSPPRALIELDIARKRALCCVSCPFKDDIAFGDTKTAMEPKRRLFLLSHGLLLEDEVGWCPVHLWDNRLACLLPRPKEYEAPHQCWLSKPDQNDLT